jgi:protein TonB
MTAANRRQKLLIAAFLLASLLLHLLALLLPRTPLFKTAEQKPPIYVEVRPPQQRDRELDLPVTPPPPKPRQTPAKRFAAQDRVAPRETAPTGEDAEDAERSSRAPRSAPAAPPTPQASPTPQPTEGQPATNLPTSPDGDRPAAAPPGRPRQVPSLDQLTRLAPTTMAKLESDWRRKYREGVEKGDTVWLDTEQDLLISFFKRFRTNIYNVWNYPEGSRLREEQGRCLLRISVSRQGTIDAVELLESSGFYALDEEALRAVRKGAPYGPLPAAYPHPQLNIMGYFSYNLSRTTSHLPGRRLYGGQ